MFMLFNIRNIFRARIKSLTSLKYNKSDAFVVLIIFRCIFCYFKKKTKHLFFFHKFIQTAIFLYFT